MNEKDLEIDIEQAKKDLAEEPAEDSPQPKQKGARKVAKKVPKKTAAKSEKAPKKVAKKTNGTAREPVKEEGVVTVAELAAEADMTAQSARVKLRAAEFDRGEGRWKWPEGSKALKEARKILGLS